MSLSLMHLETAPEKCPMCEGELYVTQSEPRAGAACPICRGPLWFLQKTVDGAVILTFLSEGKHKNSVGGRSEATFWSLKTANRAIIDLSRFSTVSNAFLETLAAIRERMNSAGGSVKICGLNAQVAEAFKRAELDDLFDIYPDEEAALESFDQSSEPSAMILPMHTETVVTAESGKIAVQA
jgi:anti-anti-sigma regulatory factor